jgi:hypothetical protein
MSKHIEQLKKFIPTIKGISESNRKGLLHLASLLEREQVDVVEHTLRFYADPARYQGSNGTPFEGDPYTEVGASYMQDVFRDHGALAWSALTELK